MMIDNFFNEIKEYFIDNNITIRENDDINIKIKKFLLKYKKIICLILIIILLIMGYYCNPYENLYNNNIQTGGAAALPGATEEKKTEEKPEEKKANAPQTEPEKSYMDKKGDKAKEKLKKRKEGAVNKLKSVANAPAGIYNAGQAAVDKFKDNADIIYQVLYSIALFILICIVTIPSLAFCVIGIICYVLLKDQLGGIKGL